MTKSMPHIFVRTLFQNDVTRLFIGVFRYRGTLNKTSSTMVEIGHGPPKYLVYLLDVDRKIHEYPFVSIY